jgi:hypothetical protein
MTATELQALLEGNDVPVWMYSFDGPGGGECYVLECAGGVWRTYYSERGGRSNEHSYSSEEAACRAMFALIDEALLQEQHRRICLDDRRALKPL